MLNSWDIHKKDIWKTVIYSMLTDLSNKQRMCKAKGKVLRNSLCTTCRDANWFRSFTQKGGNVNLAFTSSVVTSISRA